MNHDDVWRQHAACMVRLTSDGGPRVLRLLGMIGVIDTKFDSDLWFPSKGGGQVAVRVCAGCPVRMDCLTYAVESREEFGIWGGAGELVRRGLARTLAGHVVWLWLLGLPAEVSIRQRRRLFAIEAQDHFDRLDESLVTGQMPEGALDANGPNATHGRASTYARGCRCDECRQAIRESQRRNRRRRIERGAHAEGEVG